MCYHIGSQYGIDFDIKYNANKSNIVIIISKDKNLYFLNYYLVLL